MKKIGLTGGIGAGKSIVAKIFSTMGFPVFYSDQVGKKLMSEDETVKSQIIKAFGDQSYIDGELNRVFLASEIFSNDQLKEKLNNIVHPAVRNAFDDWAKKQNSELVFNEAAILFETGSYKNFDYNILVYAPEEIRIERVIKRDNTSLKQVKERMSNQWSDAKKRELSDYEIINDNKNLLVPQVEKILHSLTS